MKQFIFLLLILGLVAAALLRLRYGGGEAYEDLTTAPELSESAVQEVLRYPEPVGQVAVSGTGRLFFTVHPESRPLGNKLLEWVDGAAVPFPSGALQPRLFNSVLALHVDAFDRLWTLDHGNHGMGEARLLAIDIDSGEVLRDHLFSSDIAPAGSYLQALAVTADGGNVFIADASTWRKRPAIVIYDTTSGNSRRVLESHASVSAEDYVIASNGGEMTYLGGLVALKSGLSGIALTPNDEWLYIAAMNNDSVYRVPVHSLTDRSLPPAELAAAVQKFSRKPLSEGIAVGADGSLYVTDVEHGAIFRIGEDRHLYTLVQSAGMRWPNGLTIGPAGYVYIADSALASVILRSREDIKASGPYSVFRVPAEAGPQLSL